jgi:hypothetical protein
MEFKVHLLAFTDGKIRPVNVPDEHLFPTAIRPEDMLEDIFHYGQNEIQPLKFPSVSAGDVIEYAGKKYFIQSTGFRHMTEEEFESYRKAPKEERWKTSLEFKETEDPGMEM